MRSSQTKRSAGPSEGVAHKRNLKQKAMTRANKMLLIQNFKNEVARRIERLKARRDLDALNLKILLESKIDRIPEQYWNCTLKELRQKPASPNTSNLKSSTSPARNTVTSSSSLSSTSPNATKTSTYKSPVKIISVKKPVQNRTSPTKTATTYSSPLKRSNATSNVPPSYARPTESSDTKSISDESTKENSFQDLLPPPPKGVKSIKKTTSNSSISSVSSTSSTKAKKGTGRRPGRPRKNKDENSQNDSGIARPLRSRV